MGNGNSFPVEVNGDYGDEDYSDDDYDVGSRHRASGDEATGGQKTPPLTPEQAARCAQKRDIERPKRALTPFNCFVKERMARGGKGRRKAGDMCDGMDDLSKEWKAMSDSDKAAYTRAAAEDRLRYTNEKAKYEDDKRQCIKRPVNGYIVFMREFRQQQKGNYKNAKDLVREGAKAWKKLNKEQKQPYQQQSLNDSDRYAQERFQWCNKIVKPKHNDTRFTEETGYPDEPSAMEISDEEELKEWLKKTKPSPSLPKRSETSSE